MKIIPCIESKAINYDSSTKVIDIQVMKYSHISNSINKNMP